MSNVPEPTPAQGQWDLPGLLHAINAETLMLQRAMAGYNLLASVLSQAERPLQQGERRRGLPILRYTAPDAADGSKVIEIVSDLKRLDPAYLAHVLSPLANMHAAEMVTAVKKIHQAAGEMLNQLTAAMHPQGQIQAPILEQSLNQSAGFAPPVVDDDDDQWEEGEEVGEAEEMPPPAKPKPLKTQRRAQG